MSNAGKMIQLTRLVMFTPHTSLSPFLVAMHQCRIFIMISTDTLGVSLANIPLVRPSGGTSLGGTSCYNITTPACLRMLYGFNPNTAAQVNAANSFGIIGVYTEQLSPV